MTDRKSSAHPSSSSIPTAAKISMCTGVVSVCREGEKMADFGTTTFYEFIFFLHITVPYASRIRRKREEKSKGIHAKTHNRQKKSKKRKPKAGLD